MKVRSEMMTEVVSVTDDRALSEFVHFHSRVSRGADLTPRSSAGAIIAFLRHTSPFSEGRRFHLLAVRRQDKIVARAVAVVDDRYVRQWGEQLGHIIMYEALPNVDGATRHLIETARAWLRDQDLSVARTGFGPFETGYLLHVHPDADCGGQKHVSSAPCCYHLMLKDAGFETEKGGSEYLAQVSDETVQLYQGFVRNTRLAGYEIVAMSELPAAQRINDTFLAWNESYASHWGLSPLTRSEFSALFENAGESGLLELSAIAYRSGTPVGVILTARERKEPSVNWREGWRLFAKPRWRNSLSVGVVPCHRGARIAQALVAHSFLLLIARGATRLSYGLVLDDNSASRRVAWKLGARPAYNYLTYRMTL